MPIFVQRAQHQHLHALGRGFTACECLRTSFRHGGNRLSLWCWQDCI
nr:MAG TPA: hypothetical protein [Caudoviricetes sp.]